MMLSNLCKGTYLAYYFYYVERISELIFRTLRAESALEGERSVTVMGSQVSRGEQGSITMKESGEDSSLTKTG